MSVPMAVRRTLTEATFTRSLMALPYNLPDYPVPSVEGETRVQRLRSAVLSEKVLVSRRFFPAYTVICRIC